jgi:subtilisin family serine protease
MRDRQALGSVPPCPPAAVPCDSHRSVLAMLFIMALCISVISVWPAPAVQAGNTAGQANQNRLGAPTDVPAISLGRSDGASALSPGSSRYIVQFKSKKALDDTLADESANGTRVGNVWSHALNGFVATLSADDVRRLQNDPDVLRIELDSIMTLSSDQSNPPWGLDRIDQRALPLSNGYFYDSTGSGVTAYIVDSGIRTTHTEFTGRIPRGVSFVADDGTGFEDCSGHGTHVAGTIGGSTYGVAKAVSLVPVRVFDCSGSTDSSVVIRGLDWIVADHLAGVPAVVNMSLGGPPSPSVDAAVNAVIADGVTVVVSAGNDSDDTCNQSPARAPAAITVGASDSDDDVASYSNHGPCNDLFAPGTKILSAWDTDDTATKTVSGTSMAAPHVTGAVARLLQGSPSDTPAQVWAAVYEASTTGALTGTFGGDPNKLLYLAPVLVATTVPGAPQTLSGLGGNAQVALSWLAPLSDNGSPITDYLVQYKTPVDVWSTFAEGVSSATGATVTGLVNGTSYDFQIAAVNSLGTGPMSSPSPWVTPSVPGFTSPPPVMPPVQGFTALAPVRVFDTRAGEAQGAVQVGKQRYGGGTVLTVKVAGAAGVPVSGVGAVSLNVTVVDPVAAGFVTVYPCGDRPLASSLNYVAGQVVPNAVIAPLSAAGEVCLFSSADANLLADVNGWFATS